MSIAYNSQKWRFWPVLCLAFIFAFANPLLMLATPIHFLREGVPIKFISLLTIAMTITYSISPILLTKISDRLGRRKSIIISMIGATGLQLIFYITLNPVVFLIERLLEGFILGFFFPNLTASISDVPNIDHQKYLAKFNLSWSIAIVFGLIFGAIILQFTENLVFIFYISPIILLLNIFIAIFLFQQFDPLNFNPQDTDINYSTSNPENNQESSKISNYFIPVIIPLLFILYTSFAAGNGSFLYPIRADLLGLSPSSTYFVNTFAVVGQSISLYFASVLALNKLKLVSIITLSVYPFLFIFFIFNEIYVVFIILFLFSGLFYGMLYGAASKLFIALNVLKKTSKYSGILESSTGLTYFISMLILGFIADINILLGYFSLTLSLLVIFFITLVFIRKFKEIKRIP
ncbi:MAG: MFS transporter [Candidatus Lokiarchaeota archaeon]|nr:MFS transporter [Candidatus Lokiarchaeota archaeon]